MELNMKILIPKELFDEVIKIVDTEKLPLRSYLTTGSEFSVKGYKDFIEAKAIFDSFFFESNILDGAENTHFSRKCASDFKKTVDDALLTYLLKLLIVILCINHSLAVPDVLTICNELLTFNLEQYADPHVTAYFKYIAHYVVARLIVCPEFAYFKSSDNFTFGVRCIETAQTIAISQGMSAHKLGGIYFLMATYSDLALKSADHSSEQNIKPQLSPGVYIDRGLSNLRMNYFDQWEEFGILKDKLAKHNDMKLAVAHPDAFLLLTLILTKNHTALFESNKFTADILRKLCDRRFHFLLTQKFNIDEIISCCSSGRLPVVNESSSRLLRC